MRAPRDGLVKLRLESRLGERTVVETPWAEPLRGGRYRMQNVPWFRGDVNWRDVVEVEVADDDGPPRVTAVAEPSGHRTLRVLFDPVTDPARHDAVLRELAGIGGEHEGTGGHRHGVYAIDVAPDVDVLPLADVLFREAERGILGWREGGDPAFLLALDRAVRTENATARHVTPLGAVRPLEADEPFLVDVSDNDLAWGRRWEQLWGRPTTGAALAVRSAPFYAYELAVGDVVAVERLPGRLPVVRGVVGRSGRSTLRALLHDEARAEPVRDEVHRAGARSERQAEGRRMLAVDTPDDEVANAVFDLLQAREDRGELAFETGWR